MPAERTLFFTKSYIPERAAGKILEYLDPALLNQQKELFPLHSPVRYSVDETFIFANLSLQQWQEFYMQLRKGHPKVHDYMCRDFASQPHGIWGLVISGDRQRNGNRGIIEVVRDCLGDRILQKNPQWTIRGKFGKINQKGIGHRTVAHASTRDQAERDIELFRKWRIIH